jgi:hypothetical protein
MGRSFLRSLVPAAIAGLVGFAPFVVAAAHADPADSGSTTQTSTTDELADMVMDVIQKGAPSAPTTTPVPAPGR